MLSERDILHCVARTISMDYSELEFRQFLASLRRELAKIEGKSALKTSQMELYERIAKVGNEYIKEKYKNFDDCLEIVYSFSDFITDYPNIIFLYLFSRFYKEQTSTKSIATIIVSSKKVKDKDSMNEMTHTLLSYSYKNANVAKIVVSCPL